VAGADRARVVSLFTGPLPRCISNSFACRTILLFFRGFRQTRAAPVPSKTHPRRNVVDTVGNKPVLVSPVIIQFLQPSNLSAALAAQSFNHVPNPVPLRLQMEPTGYGMFDDDGIGLSCAAAPAMRWLTR